MYEFLYFIDMVHAEEYFSILDKINGKGKAERKAFIASDDRKLFVIIFNIFINNVLPIKDYVILWIINLLLIAGVITEATKT